MKNKMKPVHVGQDGLTSAEVELQLSAFSKRLRAYAESKEYEADYEKAIDRIWNGETDETPEWYSVVPAQPSEKIEPETNVQLALFDDVA